MNAPDNFSAVEGLGVHHGATGCTADRMAVKNKPSRVFRDDLPRPLPLGVHHFLEWLGLALFVGIVVASALFHTGVLSIEAIARRIAGA
jgi:hypothetical protein